MQHRGPHAWLTRAVTIKNRTASTGSGVAFHVALISHMLHSWAGASKEAAQRALASETEQRQTILAHPEWDEATRDTGMQALKVLEGKLEDEPLWGLGEKALRVVVQNIEALPSPWTREAYNASKDIKAAIGLITALLYAYAGVAYTLCWTDAQSGSQAVSNGHRNPYLHRGLTKLWEAVAVPQFARFFTSEVDAVHTTAYRMIHALMRAGEQGPEDTALANFNLDRLVSHRFLATQAAQTTSPNTAEEDIERLLAEDVRPSEVPALEASWVLAQRTLIFALFEQAFSSLENVIRESVESQISSAGTPNVLTTASGWLKNEDGYPVMPIALSGAVKAFFITLRSASGQEASQSNPTEDSRALSLDLANFVISLSQKARVPSYMRAELGEKGTQCATMQHLSQLLEETFGIETLEAGQENARGQLAPSGNPYRRAKFPTYRHLGKRCFGGRGIDKRLCSCHKCRESASDSLLGSRSSSVSVDRSGRLRTARRSCAKSSACAPVVIACPALARTAQQAGSRP